MSESLPGSAPPSHLARQALTTIYDIVQRAADRADLKAVAGSILEILSSRLEMSRGVIGFSSSPPVVAARGISGEEFFLHLRAARQQGSRLLPFAERPEFILQRGGEFAGTAGLASENRPARGEISFFCAPVPGDRLRGTFIAVDRLFEEDVDPVEDLRFLTAGAFLLSPLFSGGHERDGQGSEKGMSATLGRVLRQHITDWIEPMDTSRRIKSDVFVRLVDEVEKILIDAALKKTDYVQTDAARFLGINRNTLAQKIRRHGLKKKSP